MYEINKLIEIKINKLIRFDIIQGCGNTLIITCPFVHVHFDEK